MRIILTVLAVLVLSGCDNSGKRQYELLTSDLPEGRTLLTVDFQQGRTLRYKFVSKRDIASDMTGKGVRKEIDKSSESMEMIVSYTPVEVDPYGLTTILAKCESVKVRRSSKRSRRTSKKDAVETLAGKTFTFTVTATGKIKDYSQLDSLIAQAGEKAFSQRARRGRIKEPDMVGDFIVSQWFLWDAVSSLKDAAQGVAVGQSWNSQIWLATPMVMRKGRDISYSLKEIRESDKGNIAVIESSFSAGQSVPKDWPKPYPPGGFQVRGKFGFYRNYKILELRGKGTELFNIDSGMTESYNHQYEMKLSASMMIPLSGINPRITIKQKHTMQLLK